MSDRLDDTDIAIIGGGIIGCAIAYYAAKAGLDCVVLERGRLNSESSGTNAGNIHVQASHGRAADLERIRNKIVLRTGAMAVWRTLEQELGCDLGFRLCGGIVVAETDAEMANLVEKSKFEQGFGLETEILGRADMQRLEPALSPALVGGCYLRDEGYANPLLVTPAFVARAQTLGARFKAGCEVTAIDAVGGGFVVRTRQGDMRARRVVNAAGAWSGRVAAMLNVRLPIYGRVLHMNVTEPWPRRLNHRVQHSGRWITMKQSQYGTFIIGGGWAGMYDTDETRSRGTRWESMSGNTWVAARIVPLLAQVRVIRTWAGMQVMTPGDAPLIGLFPGVPGFYAAIVTSGFTVGPLVGRLVAELLTGRASSAALAPYSPEQCMAVPHA
jgi:glycine/D-amino acid oxidase-like deaminating enzyme